MVLFCLCRLLLHYGGPVLLVAVVVGRFLGGGAAKYSSLPAFPRELNRFLVKVAVGWGREWGALITLRDAIHSRG